MKLAIDTNVVLRYLLADDIKQATTARKIMKEVFLCRYFVKSYGTYHEAINWQTRI